MTQVVPAEKDTVVIIKVDLTPEKYATLVAELASCAYIRMGGGRSVAILKATTNEKSVGGILSVSIEYKEDTNIYFLKRALASVGVEFDTPLPVLSHRFGVGGASVLQAYLQEKFGDGAFWTNTISMRDGNGSHVFGLKRVPFEVQTPIEYWRSWKNDQRCILLPGLYRVVEHMRSESGAGDLQMKVAYDHGGNTEHQEIILCKGRAHFDWRGVRNPDKK